MLEYVLGAKVTNAVKLGANVMYSIWMIVMYMMTDIWLLKTVHFHHQIPTISSLGSVPIMLMGNS